MLNKKAQMGETVTWVVATIAIILILSLSLYGASLLAKSREANYLSSSFFSKGYQRNQDVVMQKSLFAYFLLKGDYKDVLYSRLTKMDEQKEFHGDFQSDINGMEEVLGSG